jgi:hypothetical protein
MSIVRNLFGDCDGGITSVGGLGNGDEGRCLGCAAVIVKDMNKKSSKNFCGPGCEGVNEKAIRRAGLFAGYELCLASEVRPRLLSVDGAKIIMSFLYNEEHGVSFTDKLPQIERAIFKNLKIE